MLLSSALVHGDVGSVTCRERGQPSWASLLTHLTERFSQAHWHPLHADHSLISKRNGDARLKVWNFAHSNLSVGKDAFLSWYCSLICARQWANLSPLSLMSVAGGSERTRINMYISWWFGLKLEAENVGYFHGICRVLNNWERSGWCE